MCDTNVFRVSVIYLFLGILNTVPMGMPYIKNVCFSHRCVNYTSTLLQVKLFLSIKINKYSSLTDTFQLAYSLKKFNIRQKEI
jgi:hypothetical protein